MFLFRQAFRDAGAFSRRHFLPLFLIMLCGAAPRFFLVTPGSPAEYGLPPSLNTNFIDYLIQAAIILPSVFTSLVVIFASLQYLDSFRVDYKAALQWAVRRVLIVCVALGLLLFFTGLLIFAVALAIALVGHGFVAGKGFINSLIGLWAGFSLIGFYISFIIFTPVVAIERRGFWPSVRQALFLTRGRRWKLLLIFFAAIGGYMAIAGCVSLIGIIPSVAEILPSRIGDYAAIIETAITSYLTTTLQAVLYYRLRQIEEDPLTSVELIPMIGSSHPAKALAARNDGTQQQ
ncbi:hypothetical protein ACFPL7_04195 [Dongia soli]|uniref:Glycerophosphoryl diester phosphodiesterase membrane domain-containing protein n=1 Tax=Dongia soli TaxID=600628 RepID=A0ABU5EDX2_9PROT|nr:hypothetical protein [Dongia soli]MDY0884507.1 hypothetical protein [Dongia soli]